MSNQTNKLNRRKFIKLSAFAASALAISSCKKDILNKKNNQPCTLGNLKHKKIIIIGSGFGGSIAAKRLTQAGHEVTILERGKEWKPDGNTQVFSDALGTNNKAAWLSLESPLPTGITINYPRKYVGILEKIKTPTVNINAAACLGGGSVTFGGIWAKPNPILFNQIFPAEISFAELETYFPKVLNEMQCTSIPQNLAANNLFKHATIFKNDNVNAGINNVNLLSNFRWNIIEDEINGTKIKSCIIGESNLGMNSGAKITTNDTYLKDAIDTGRLEIKTLSIVKEISLNCDNNYVIYVEEIDEQGKVINTINYSAEYLFLAAGSVGTSKLLTKAKAKNTIPNLNDEVGKGWGNNGNAMFLRTINQNINTNQSFPPTIAGEDYSDLNNPFYIENFPFNFSNFDLRILGYNFIGNNTTRGYFKYNESKDEAELIYPQKSQNNQRFVNDAAKEKLKKINQINGGDISSLLGAVPQDSTTPHPLGGIVITKATDAYGRLKNQKKLYAIDSSLIPGATVCNPALTVCAIVERNIENILNNDF